MLRIFVKGIAQIFPALAAAEHCLSLGQLIILPFFLVKSFFLKSEIGRKQKWTSGPLVGIEITVPMVLKVLLGVILLQLFSETHSYQYCPSISHLAHSPYHPRHRGQTPTQMSFREDNNVLLDPSTSASDKTSIPSSTASSTESKTKGENIRAVDMKFTSTLLTHYDNKLVYKLDDGRFLTLKRVQYLDEAQDCAEFTVRTFFDETKSTSGVETNKEKLSKFVDSINPFRANNIQQLVEIQTKELNNRLNHPYAAMFMIEDTSQGGVEIVGFSEIFTQSFDEEAKKFKDPLPAALINREALKVGQPKIANFCVQQKLRKQGVGKLLLSACLSQANDWGYEQALLLVDADNAAARSFYRYQGFFDVAYESGMRKYDVNTMRLSSVRSPKYLMQRPL